MAISRRTKKVDIPLTGLLNEKGYLYLQIAWFDNKAVIDLEIIVPLKKKIKRVDDM